MSQHYKKNDTELYRKDGYAHFLQDDISVPNYPPLSFEAD